MAQGLRSSYGVAAPPFTKGPYTWDQQLTISKTLTGDGEAIRAFAKIEAAAATARGSHISLDIGTGGSCSSLGAGVDAQVLVVDGALSGGTYAAQNIEWYAAGSNTDISGVTQSSFIRCNLGGDATGLANIEDNVNFLAIAGGSVAAGNMFAAQTAAVVSHTLRVNIYGTTYYLMVSDAQ